MSNLNPNQRQDLDNYITGHYGEDQYSNQEQNEEDLQESYRNYKTPFLRTRAGVICKHLVLFITFQSLGWLFWWFVITMGWKH